MIVVLNALRAELLRRQEADQEVRHAAHNAASASGQIPQELGERWLRIDTENTAFLKQAITVHGWPDRDMVGADGANAAWLLAQHADHDVAFQRSCLRWLEQAVAAGRANPAHAAFLTDRVRVADGLPQLYGTQYTNRDGQFGPYPIKDREHLDERRARVGLEPIAEYDRCMREL